MTASKARIAFAATLALALFSHESIAQDGAKKPGTIRTMAITPKPEEWKEPPRPEHMTAGVLMGLGLIDPKAGFVVLPNVGFRVAEEGFVPDISNEIFAELAAGPVFVSGGTALTFSAHLRWDFVKDATWAPYALGGVGGNSTGSALGDRFMIYPRVAVGVFRKLQGQLSLRAEASHEYVTAGLSVGF